MANCRFEKEAAALGSAENPIELGDSDSDMTESDIYAPLPENASADLPSEQSGVGIFANTQMICDGAYTDQHDLKVGGSAEVRSKIDEWFQRTAEALSNGEDGYEADNESVGTQ